MKGKKRALLSIIVVIFTVFSFIGCSSGREYDEQEVKAAATELIKKAEFINELYYGEGLPYIDNEQYAVGYYYMADAEYAKAHGIQTVEDIKLLTRSVFSIELSNIMISTRLTSVSETDGTIRGYARYHQKTASDGSPECILVYKNADIYLTDEIIYDYEGIRVIGSEGEVVFVEIDATVNTEDGRSQVNTIKIGLLEETFGWRLDSSTYTRYVDKDAYNNLQNK